ncbi:MAG: Asp-tRNA(Asn)/Glu-tRNA(Gln) amidotransferase subunit GatC [Actinomycetia bacterium]|nr:Asp-tRNA(Asn)/Glu-tRNA(Gln) amidotransferase subunit GatC [Actinomycetes bacterium]
MCEESSSVGRITRHEVEQVARLALLDLTDDQIDRFTAQLAAVLDHAEDVEALDLSGVEPTFHPYPLVNVMRADEVGTVLDRDEVLNQAPVAEDDRFRVPPALGEAP